MAKRSAKARKGAAAGRAKVKAARPTAVRDRRVTTPARTTPGPKQFRVIHVLSDSTGNLAKHMLTAFLTQFPAGTFDLRLRTFVRGPAALRQAMDAVSAEPGIVFHAVVADDAKGRIAEECGRLGVPACDLTGNFVEFLATHGGVRPTQDPGRLHHVDETYHRRIEAVEFAMAHDDGLGLETLHEADVVLCGVSRTSKTPTTIYLAQQGLLVGNVALAMEVEPPQELLRLPREKVAALVIDPNTLTDIRTNRQGAWKMPSTSYNDEDHVRREVEWSRRLFRERGWTVIDVTNQAIEETAARIVDVMRLGRLIA